MRLLNASLQWRQNTMDGKHMDQDTKQHTHTTRHTVCTLFFFTSLPYTMAERNRITQNERSLKKIGKWSPGRHGAFLEAGVCERCVCVFSHSFLSQTTPENTTTQTMHFYLYLLLRLRWIARARAVTALKLLKSKSHTTYWLQPE